MNISAYLISNTFRIFLESVSCVGCLNISYDSFGVLK